MISHVPSSPSALSKSNSSRSQLTALKSMFSGQLSIVTHLYKAQPRCPGYPKWYEELCARPESEDWTDRICDLTPAKKIAPLLLRMSWMGMPLHYHEKLKWGYICLGEQLKSQGSHDEITSAAEFDFPNEAFCQMMECRDEPGYEDTDKNGEYCTLSGQQRENSNQFFFVKLPHKDGKHLNVGNPLSKDFLEKLRQENMILNIIFSTDEYIYDFSEMVCCLQTPAKWLGRSWRAPSQYRIGKAIATELWNRWWCR